MRLHDLYRTAGLYVLAAVMPFQTAVSAAITVEFSLEVTQHEVGWGHLDPTFTPYTTTISLQFDPTVVERYADGGPFGEVFFAAENVFSTPFTSGLPWSTPEATDSDRERNLAVFEFEKISETEGQQYMYWDDRYRHNDGAGREYFYGTSIGSNVEAGAQMVLDPNTLDTLDLISYLEFHQQGGWAMEFDEFTWIYDYGIHQDVVFEAYSGLARITSIDTGATVPVPPAVWLFGSALGVIGTLSRKSIRPEFPDQSLCRSAME